MAKKDWEIKYTDPWLHLLSDFSVCAPIWMKPSLSQRSKEPTNPDLISQLCITWGPEQGGEGKKKMGLEDQRNDIQHKCQFCAFHIMLCIFTINLNKVVILILQIKKMRFRNNKWLIWEYATNNWWIQGLIHCLCPFHQVYLLGFMCRESWEHSRDTYYPVKRPAETRLSGTASWGKMIPELNFEGTLV